MPFRLRQKSVFHYDFGDDWNFDILIEAHLPDNESLYEFLNEQLEEIEGIAYTETWHILRTDKTNFEWEGENVGKEPLGA